MIALRIYDTDRVYILQLDASRPLPEWILEYLAER
jgi:hypothetical protein